MIDGLRADKVRHLWPSNKDKCLSVHVLMVAERRCLEQVGRKENNRRWGLSSPLAYMASGKHLEAQWREYLEISAKMLANLSPKCQH